MGWAKYDEDIREAIEDRWTMKGAYKPATSYSNSTSHHHKKAALYSVATYYNQKTNIPNTYRTEC